MPQCPNAKRFLYWAAIAASVFGCSSESDSKLRLPIAGTEIASANEPQDRKVVFDLGVVFCDRKYQAHFPLSRLNLVSPEQIQSLSTSCDCVELSMTSYVGVELKENHAIRVEIKPIKHQDARDPQNLCVNCRILLQDGSTQEFEACFAHVSRVLNSQTDLSGAEGYDD